MTKMTITYEFDSHEDESELKGVIYGELYRNILWDIDQTIRNTLKHDDRVCENEYFYSYLENIRETINGGDIYD